MGIKDLEPIREYTAEELKDLAADATNIEGDPEDRAAAVQALIEGVEGIQGLDEDVILITNADGTVTKVVLDDDE